MYTVMRMGGYVESWFRNVENLKIQKKGDNNEIKIKKKLPVCKKKK